VTHAAQTGDAAKGAAPRASSLPMVSPAVVRSLYRSLYREVHYLDADPVVKTLFPCTKELQSILGVSSPLYIPNGKSYTEALRQVFRDAQRLPHISLAFDTLNRLRAHRSNVKDKLAFIVKDRERLLTTLRSERIVAKRKTLFRAQPLAPAPNSAPRYVQATSGVPTRVVLRNVGHLELSEGTLLLAHPLSSTYVDRRVLLITERTPLMTTAVVLDLQFTYPLSRGNPMFPEEFWGHDVYDGGFSQIGFTMPPTAQMTILHTLKPATATPRPATGGVSVMDWLRWKGPQPTSAAAGGRVSFSPTSSPATAVSPSKEHHELLCRPLIHGGVLDSGEEEPTLFLSKTEALPYLAGLVVGQPRSTLRVYWGNMRWTTAQIEAEVANGHWMAVKVSPSFFQSYSLTTVGDDAAERFPTAADLRDARDLRKRQYGADVTPPQVFPPDQILRRRESLWDEVMFALGGEYAALVGCANPFSSSTNWPTPQILAPLSARLPLADEKEEDDDDDDEEKEVVVPIPSHASGRRQGMSDLERGVDCSESCVAPKGEKDNNSINAATESEKAAPVPPATHSPEEHHPGCAGGKKDDDDMEKTKE